MFPRPARVSAFCPLVVPLTAVASGVENLLRNGGFESGADGWSLDGATGHSPGQLECQAAIR